MPMKTWKTVGVGVVVFGLAFGIWQLTKLTIPENEQNKPTNQILDTDWVLGNPQGIIKVVEYSDLQCPACKIYNGVGERIVESFGDQVGFTYRHFPLKQIHPNATLAAQAAEAAGKQGKFWQMMELLFTHQLEWEGSNQVFNLYTNYANQLGLNQDQFRREIDAKDVKALVEADYLSGLVAKIDSTPTFYINGQKINNLKSAEDLITRIRFELEDATKSSQPTKE